MSRYFFTPPNVDEGPAGFDILFYRYKLPRGITVLKKNGQYFEVRFAHIDELMAADLFYQGGHIYEVSAGEAADLQAAGYTVDVEA